MRFIPTPRLKFAARQMEISENKLTDVNDPQSQKTTSRMAGGL
jgi:hypothetical protein